MKNGELKNQYKKIEGIKIRLERIKKSFFQNGKPIPVLHEISLTAKEGELISVIGPSGCGKTTLFNIVAGIIPPDDGCIFIDGKNVRSGRGFVAYMQQKDLLFPWRKVIDNVLLGPELMHEPLKEAREEALKLLSKFGLSGFEFSYPCTLSGGMRQRVALVRTLLFKKDILLLDEPFGALDAMTRSVMQNYLLSVWQEYRKTILLITHDVEEALLLSTRIYVLTARPAKVKKIVMVPLSYPRDVTDKGLISFKKEILSLVREEMEKVFYER